MNCLLRSSTSTVVILLKRSILFGLPTCPTHVTMGTVTRLIGILKYQINFLNKYWMCPSLPSFYNITYITVYNLASPSSEEAYKDQKLTTSFEFKFFVCRHVSIWGFQNRVCLSVSICPYPEKRNHHSFVNISLTFVIDQSMETSSRVLQHGNPKIWLKKKFKIQILTCAEELKSPSLRQYQSYISNWHINGKVFKSTTAWEPKNLIFSFKNVWNSNFDLCWRAEITIASSISVLCW